MTFQIRKYYPSIERKFPIPFQKSLKWIVFKNSEIPTENFFNIRNIETICQKMLSVNSFSRTRLTHGWHIVIDNIDTFRTSSSLSSLTLLSKNFTKLKKKFSQIWKRFALFHYEFRLSRLSEIHSLVSRLIWFDNTWKCLRVQVVSKKSRETHFKIEIFNFVYTEAWSVLGCGVVWYEVLPGAPAGCKLSCNWCCWAFALRQAMLSFLSCSVSWVAPEMRKKSMIRNLRKG